MVVWFKYHKEPYQEVKDKWLATRAYRVEKDYNDKDKHLQDILKKYPVLKQSFGYKLVNRNLNWLQARWHEIMTYLCGCGLIE